MTPFGYTVLGFGGGKNQTYTAVSESIPLGAKSALFAGSYASSMKADADPNTINKFIAVYALTSWAGPAGGTTRDIHCIVGTLGSTAVTYATPVSAGTVGNDWLDIKYSPHTAGKFVLVYADTENGNYGTAVVGTVSGDSISFATPVVFASANVQYVSIAMDFNTADKFVVHYRNMTDNSYGYAIVGTISGTSLSFGTAVKYSGSSSVGVHLPAIAYDRKTANKVLIVYQDDGNSNYGTAIVGTVSGTDISFGTAVVFDSAESSTISNCLTGDPFNANKFFNVYRDDNGYPKMVCCTVSGTTVSFGTINAFESYAVTPGSIDACPNTENKFVIGGKGTTTYAGNGVIYVVSVSGTTLSIESGEHAYGGDQHNDGAQICFDHDPSNAGKFSLTYSDQHSYGQYPPAGYLGAGYAGQIASQTPDP